MLRGRKEEIEKCKAQTLKIIFLEKVIFFSHVNKRDFVHNFLQETYENSSLGGGKKLPMGKGGKFSNAITVEYNSNSTKIFSAPK